ncbi:WD40 repeat domain-containing serine/threonine protein kinase [Fimbriiglobus ruber]|nr:serine/threonine-protein kinase [Fimbriiglobus ruber]
MGTVWVAQQTEPVKRLVAIKLIKTGMDSKAVLARFEAERQALAVMDHPNIARVLDGGATADGRPYFVMELVKGVPITQFCDERKLTPRQRLEIFVPVCQAIQHAHQKGVIHRDIKPSNVLIALYDDKPVPKVIDFGIAKATGTTLTDRTLVTGFGAVVGTPEYMSPEQASLNNLDIDTRSDVYSLGVLLYELLTGTTPVDRKSLGKAAMLEVLRIVREVDAPRPSARLSGSGTLPSAAANRGTEPAALSRLLRRDLDWVVLRAMEKDRVRRYESAAGFAADVQRYLAGEAVQAHPPSTAYRLRTFARKNRVALATVTAFVGLLIGAVVVSGWLAIKAKRAEETAEKKRGEAEENAKEASENAERADRFRWESAGKAAQLEISLQRSELTAVSREIDLDLIECQSNPRVGLLRLVRTLRTIHDAKTTPTIKSHFKINGEPIDIPSYDWVEQTQLREFVTAAVLATGQGYTPLLPPITHDGHRVLRGSTSPDGLTLLTHGEDSTARLWELRTGRPIATLREATERVINCGFSPDGRTVFTDDESDTARFWTVPDGKFRARTAPRPYMMPRAISISRTTTISDNRLLKVHVVYGEFESIPGFGSRARYDISPAELWDTTTGRLVARLSGHGRNEPVYRFGGGGRWVTTIEGESTALVLSAEDGHVLARLGHQLAENEHLRLVSEADNLIATVSTKRDGGECLRLWDPATWKERAPPVYASSATFNDLQFSNDQLFGIYHDTSMSSSSVYRYGSVDPIIGWVVGLNVPTHALSHAAQRATLENGWVLDTRNWQRLHPPAGRKYHPDLARFAPDGRFIGGFIDNANVIIDTATEKHFPSFGPLSGANNASDFVLPGFRGWVTTPLINIPDVGLVTAVYGYASYAAEIRMVPSPRAFPPDLLELWVQVAVRGELRADREFVKWDAPTWERKRQQLAAVPTVQREVPFPGYVAQDKLHWLRAEFAVAKTDADKLGIAKELLRRAETAGDRNEAVRWRAEVESRTTAVAPPPREAKP